jgi:hypothetical protein
MTQKQERQLQAHVPIDFRCRKIGDDQHSWQQLERHISEHYGVKFRRGICPGRLEQIMQPDPAKTAPDGDPKS